MDPSGDNNFAGPVGGPGLNNGAMPNLDNLGGAGGEGGDDINQYYDDAGETFLPADHVSILIQILTRCYLIASHGSSPKRPYQATH